MPRIKAPFSSLLTLAAIGSMACSVPVDDESVGTVVDSLTVASAPGISVTYKELAVGLLGNNYDYQANVAVSISGDRALLLENLNTGLTRALAPYIAPTNPSSSSKNNPFDLDDGIVAFSEDGTLKVHDIASNTTSAVATGVSLDSRVSIGKNLVGFLSGGKIAYYNRVSKVVTVTGADIVSSGSQGLVLVSDDDATIVYANGYDVMAFDVASQTSTPTGLKAGSGYWTDFGGRAPYPSYVAQALQFTLHGDNVWSATNEQLLGTDVNADGDLEDVVLGHANLASGTVEYLPIALSAYSSVDANDGFVTAIAEDGTLVVYKVADGSLLTTGIAAVDSGPGSYQATVTLYYADSRRDIVLDGNTIAFRADEAALGLDLNGDGDQTDILLGRATIPGNTRVLYEDDISDWDNWSWNGVWHTVSSPVYSGTSAIMAKQWNWGASSMYYRQGPIDTTGYTHLRFYVYGVTATSWGNWFKMRLSLDDPNLNKVKISDYMNGDIQVGVWKEVNVPLTHLGVSAGGQFRRISFQEYSNDYQAIALDKIELH